MNDRLGVATAEVSKVYVSGPMSGIPDHNFPAFHEAAKHLRGNGYTVVSPAELDEEDVGGIPEAVEVGGLEYIEYLKRDVEHVVHVDALVMLPGWQKSRGARFEAYIAAGLEKPVYSYVTGERIAFEQISSAPQTDESVLEEAQRLVGGSRGPDYGHPYDDFGRQAQIISVILGHEVSAHQIPLLMMAVKLSRHVNKPKRDNMVDIAGYALTAEMVAEREGSWRK